MNNNNSRILRFINSLLILLCSHYYHCILPTCFAFSSQHQNYVVHVPDNWKDNDNNKQSSSSRFKDAANILKDHGVVALKKRGNASSSSSSSLIDEDTCNGAMYASQTRLQEMHRRIQEGRGMDPQGIEDGPYRFSEIICRDEGGKRYDLPVEWLGNGRNSNTGATTKTTTTAMTNHNVGSGRIGTPLQQQEADAISDFHTCLNQIIQPVLNSFWSLSAQEAEDHTTTAAAASSSYVAAAGFLVNEPGSESQNWHRDGPDEGYIDCFVPLIDLDHSMGPTALQPGTHHDSTTTTTKQQQEEEEHAAITTNTRDGNILVPLLKKGEILLFDYRTLHRGQGNKSKDTTRTLAYAVFRQKQETNSGDIHNFPAALTLEYD